MEHPASRTQSYPYCLSPILNLNLTMNVNLTLKLDVNKNQLTILSLMLAPQLAQVDMYTLLLVTSCDELLLYYLAIDEYSLRKNCTNCSQNTWDFL